jgi:hypothetical protein
MTCPAVHPNDCIDNSFGLDIGHRVTPRRSTRWLIQSLYHQIRRVSQWDRLRYALAELGSGRQRTPGGEHRGEPAVRFAGLTAIIDSDISAGVG